MWEPLAPSPMPVLLAAQRWYFFVCSRGNCPFSQVPKSVAGSANVTPAQLRTMALEREARRQASFLVAAAVVAADSAACQLRGVGVACAAGGSILLPLGTQAVPVSSSRRHMHRSASSSTSSSSSSSRAAAASAAATAAAAAVAGRVVDQKVG